MGARYGAMLPRVVHDAPINHRCAMMHCKYYVYVNVNWIRVIPRGLPMSWGVTLSNIQPILES